MAKCTIINEPVVPKLPDKVVLEMTGDEAARLLGLLAHVWWQSGGLGRGISPYSAPKEALGTHANLYTAKFLHMNTIGISEEPSMIIERSKS